MKPATHPERTIPPPKATPEKPEPPEIPFTLPARPEVTGETESSTSGYDPRFPDVSWVGTPQMGGGHVPDDFFWRSNPTEEREEERLGL